MARVLPTVFVLAILAASAAADRIQLSDGRTLTGVVTIEGDTVQIVMEYGTIRVARSEVVSVEMRDTPEMELAKRLAAAGPDDVAALCEVAKWASQNHLPHQAEEIFGKVIKLDPNNAAARSALEYVKIDGEWRTFSGAMELAHNKLDAGQYEAVLSDVLPALDAVARTKDRQQALREMWGLANLRAAKIGAAAKAFEALGAKASPLEAVRFNAIADILKENPDGMYILAEPYPPAGDLLGGDQPAVKAGPASLTDPRVLQAALADRARKDIQSARQFLDEMRTAADREAAKTKGWQAVRSMDRADALAPGIARSYRVELVRFRIETLRKDADGQAKDFDKETASLGKSDMPSGAYRAKVQKMISQLDAIRENLKEILEISKQFPRELLLEVRLAEDDLKTIKDKRDVLTSDPAIRN